MVVYITWFSKVVSPSEVRNHKCGSVIVFLFTINTAESTEQYKWMVFIVKIQTGKGWKSNPAINTALEWFSRNALKRVFM